MAPDSVTNVRLPGEALRAFCDRWKIAEFALFGSVLSDRFGPDSDIDVLVTFVEDARWSAFDHFRMERELSELLGHRTEIVTRRALDESGNWIIRKSILESARPIDVTG